MAFNPTSLETWSDDSGRAISTKAVASAKTASLLIAAGHVTAGVKGSAIILTMEADVNFQSGADCGRNPLGSTNTGDIKVTVTPIKDEQDFCHKALYNSWFSKMLATGQNPETETLDAAFANSIMENRAAKIADKNEVALWQGDTASGDDNLNQYDGILKQITGVTALTLVGSTIVAKLQSVYKQSNIVTRKQDDFRIFISEELYDAYVVEVEALNRFRETAPFNLIGTTAKLEVMPGLNGQDVVVATRLSNFHLAMDGTDDSHRAEFRYSMETKKWYQDFHWSIGVKVLYTSADQIAKATIAE